MTMQDELPAAVDVPVTEPARPPAHIAAAFGADGTPGELLPGFSRRVWRHGDIVLRPAGEAVAAAWVAGIFESLRISGMRVARPVRSLDGRWVVGGWRAERFLSGRPAARYDDVVTASVGLDRALQHVAPPRFVVQRPDWYGWLDRLSWESDADPGNRLGDGHASHLWFDIASGRAPIDSPRQVIHGDMFGNVLFAGAAPPGVIGFTALARPAGFAAALVVVDAIAWGGAPLSLASDQAAALPHWGQLLRRACLFRLAMALTHPRADAETEKQITSAIEDLRPHLG